MRRVVVLVSALALVLIAAPVSDAAAAPDLTITKTGPANAAPGTTISYTITLSNVGDADAVNAAFTDALPGNAAGDMMYASITAPDGWLCTAPDPGENGTVACSMDPLGPGAQATFTLRATVPDTATLGATYTNTATATTDSTESDTTNNDSSVTTTVTAAPTAAGDTATVTEDSGANTIDVLANDTGSSKQVVAVTQPTNGIALITNDGANVSYTPDQDYCGSDSFDYTLNGGSTATVSITVTCVDDPPTAMDDSATVGEDSGQTPIDVLTNDTDVDGGPKNVASVTQPAHGTASSAAAYTPAANYCGPDSFTYTLNGGSTAIVSVTVTCVDDPPVAHNDSQTVAHDSGPTAIDVLANDTDVDGGPKSIASVTQPAHGMALADASYQPAAGYCGPDSFTYTLNGGSTATVAITVTCAPVPKPVSAKLAHLVIPLVHGKVSPRVLCKGPSGSRCKGGLRLRSTGRKPATSKRAPFDIATGKGKTLKLTPPAVLARQVARKGDANAVAVIRYGQVDGTTVTVKRKITLVKPSRR
jgi:uncharacterized repeat protein (TIGR01451 family)